MGRLTRCGWRPYDLDRRLEAFPGCTVPPGGIAQVIDLRTGGQSLADNRKTERVPSRLRCWCEGENVTVYARIGNLSEGGLFLRTSTPLERGSRTVVRFGESNIEATAQVVWARTSDG